MDHEPIFCLIHQDLVWKKKKKSNEFEGLYCSPVSVKTNNGGTDSIIAGKQNHA